MNDYFTLRYELIANSQIVAQFLIMSITGAVAVLGFGVQSQGKNGLLFLAPFLLTIPAIWFITSQVHSSVRIAAYIKMNIEPDSDGELRWESELERLREQSSYGPPDFEYLFAMCTIYRIIGIACLLLSIGVAARVRWQQTSGSWRVRLAEFRSIAKWLPLTTIFALGITAFVVQEVALADLGSAFTSSYGEYVEQWNSVQSN